MQIPDELLGRNKTERYPQAFAAYERRCSGRHGRVYENIVNRLGAQLNHAGQPLHILDVGVGTGSIAYITKHLHGPRPRITAIDLQAHFFPKAAERLICSGILDMHFLVLDMHSIDQSPGLQEDFDITVASNVLYRHVDNSSLLRKLLDTCKVGGWLVIVHATENAPWTNVLTELGSWTKECHGSQRLLRTIKKLGWKQTTDRVSYTVEVQDVLQATHASEELTDFLLWLLPRSTSLSSDVAMDIRASLARHCIDRRVIEDQRDIILIQRDAP